MLKILTSEQIKQLDVYTIQREPIASIDLMERACQAFVNWFISKFSVDQKVGVVCGTGNNGGDGLGIARVLNENGYAVSVWIIKDSMKESDDFKINFERINEKISVSEIRTTIHAELFKGQSILIDAIFGSGLSRLAEGIYADVIQEINKTNVVKVSVDIPSGLFANTPSEGAIVKADHTLAFQLPKLSFLFPQSNPFTGEWHIVDIGLNQEFIDQATTNYFLLEKKDIQHRIKKRNKFAHKGNFGHALLIAGSYGKIGAAVLSARAALRSGVGLLTVHVPQCGYEILQTAVPEAMVDVDQDEKIFTSLPDINSFSAIGVGPGIGQDKRTVSMFTKFLETADKPIVLDADAINILGANRELIDLIPRNSILTPHPKEFERLVGSWKNDFERHQKQLDFAHETGAIILLKGAHSSIASPDGKVHFNNTGNPGMATGGSGDVLTGIITSLLAQGYSPLNAAFVGCWIHGSAGDLAEADFGQISMVASDLIDYLPEAFRIN